MPESYIRKRTDNEALQVGTIRQRHERAGDYRDITPQGISGVPRGEASRVEHSWQCREVLPNVLCRVRRPVTMSSSKIIFWVCRSMVSRIVGALRGEVPDNELTDVVRNRSDFCSRPCTQHQQAALGLKSCTTSINFFHTTPGFTHY